MTPYYQNTMEELTLTELLFYSRNTFQHPDKFINNKIISHLGVKAGENVVPCYSNRHYNYVQEVQHNIEKLNKDNIYIY